MISLPPLRRRRRKRSRGLRRSRGGLRSRWRPVHLPVEHPHQGGGDGRHPAGPVHRRHGPDGRRHLIASDRSQLRRAWPLPLGVHLLHGDFHDHRSDRRQADRPVRAEAVLHSGVVAVTLPLGSAALLVLFFGMPAFRPVSRPKLDYRGIVLLVATVVPALLAFSWAGSRYDWASPQIIGMLSWATAALAVFAWAEMRAEEPLLPMGLFRNPIFLVSAVVTFLTGVAMFGSLSYIPLFVQGVIGSSATNSGFVTMPMMIAMAIASAISGQIMSRVGRYRLLGVAGLLIMAAGVFMLSRMDVHSTNFIATRNVVIMGIGLGMSLPLFMLAVQNTVSHRVMGVATSTMQFLRSVGGTMGVAIMGSMIN